ncbi:MAG TPA: hypothetical protein VI299_30115 [Polyangiales bacterium]
MAIFTELQLTKPSSLTFAERDRAEYEACYADQKIPLRDLLLMNDWVRDDHRFMFMACRSPWPAGLGTHKGPERIHTWYSEDHVTVDLAITG